MFFVQLNKCKISNVQSAIPHLNVFGVYIMYIWCIFWSTTVFDICFHYTQLWLVVEETTTMQTKVVGSFEEKYSIEYVYLTMKCQPAIDEQLYFEHEKLDKAW